MKFASLPILAAIIFFASCKKEIAPPPFTGNPNNELKATVSVIGEPTVVHHSRGSSTGFSRDLNPNGDTVIFVSGSTGKYGTRSSRKIQIILVNISRPGTYNFHLNTTTLTRQYVLGHYFVGDIFFSTVSEMYFSDVSTAPGSVTIDLLTPTEIRGTFTTNCSNTQLLSAGVDFARITNGTFKGTFE